MYLTICNHRAATLLNWRVRRSSRGRATIMQSDKKANTNTRVYFKLPTRLSGSNGGVRFRVPSFSIPPRKRQVVARNVHVYLVTRARLLPQRKPVHFDVSENENGHQMQKSREIRQLSL